MIKGLKTKVFLIVMISISLVLIGIIVIFAYSNYNNTINATISVMDKFYDFLKMPNSTNMEVEIELNGDKIYIDLSDTYVFVIENNKIISSYEEKNTLMEGYALKAYNTKKDSGIIGNYVYRTKNLKDGRIIIILMKNENVAARIKQIYIFTISASILAIIITCVISRKISNLIVKPVEETIQKQKQFISDASHELKTPLAVIEANVDVLESQVGESKWMTYIQSEITSMNKLINDLLFLTRIENINELKTKEIFDVSEEVNMTTSMFESMAYEKQITIEYNIEDNIKINGNKEDIKQVLSILLDNAIMHTKQDGKIIVELSKDKNNVILQVKNEGEPIPEEERSKIFGRFYRIDKSRNRKEKRYGLGLAIAKSIVEQYNGKIDVNCKDGFTIFKINISI